MWSLLCYGARARDHCCVLCDVTRDLLLGISCTSLIECKSSVKITWPLHYAPNNVNLEGEAGQRPGIWQRKSAHDGDFWLPPSPGDGDVWISSHYGRHLGLETVKYLVTSRLSVALQWGLVTKDGGHCSRKDLRVFFVRMCKENVTSYLFLSSVFSFKWIYPFTYVIISGN